MNPEPEQTTTQTAAEPPLGKFGELVFDDEPLEPLLAGTEPIAPTPASILKLWAHGIDRSEHSLRALIAVLGNSKEPQPLLGNLEGAEECLREALGTGLTKSEREYAACCSSLAQLLQMKDRLEEAEPYYRRALEIQERVLGFDDETTAATVRQLVKLLRGANRQNEATRFLNVTKARRLAGKSDDSSLWEIRQVALDMVLIGQYAEAEVIYRQLLEKRFAPGSTYCHLARIFLMTDRGAEAREAVKQAWSLKGNSPTYAIARIQFLRTLMPMLAGEDWKPNLLELKTALSAPEVHMVWTMEPVLEHLKSRLGGELHAMLTAILAAIGSPSKLKDLDANPTWRSVCGIEEPAPKTETMASLPPEAAPAIPAKSELVSHADKPGDASQNPTPGPQSETVAEADKFTFGVVVKVGGDCVTIREYNFARDADEEVDYRVTPRTEFGNVTKADELKPGDSVVVDFTESGGHNLILILVKEDIREPSAGNSEPEQPLHASDPSLDDNCHP